jgi:thiol-disulfide isomerase/thioredoxin
MAAPDIRPYWFFVAGFVLLYVFAFLFYRPAPRRHYHPTGIIPGETRHMLYEGFHTSSHTFYMIGTSWCPHCRNAKPVFEGLGPTMTIDGKTVDVKYVDADEDKATAEKFQVSGYPTFVLMNGSQAAPAHDGARDAESLLAYVKKYLA